MNLDLVAALRKDGRAATRAEESSLIVADLADNANRFFWKYGGGVKQRPVMFAAIEAVTQADPIGPARRRNPHGPAEATAGDPVPVGRLAHDRPTARFTAEQIAFSEAVTIFASAPTPKMVVPSSVCASTYATALASEPLLIACSE